MSYSPLTLKSIVTHNTQSFFNKNCFIATYIFIKKGGDNLNLKEERWKSYDYTAKLKQEGIHMRHSSMLIWCEDYRSLHISNTVCQSLLLPDNLF